MLTITRIQARVHAYTPRNRLQTHRSARTYTHRCVSTRGNTHHVQSYTRAPARRNACQETYTQEHTHKHTKQQTAGARTQIPKHTHKHQAHAKVRQRVKDTSAPSGAPARLETKRNPGKKCFDLADLGSGLCPLFRPFQSLLGG